MIKVEAGEMLIQVSMGVATQEDARRLLPSVNLFSLATTPESRKTFLLTSTRIS